MAGLGAPELVIILVVVLLLFGTSRLPKLARSIGEASREFKSGVLSGGSSSDEPASPVEAARVDEAEPANEPAR